MGRAVCSRHNVGIFLQSRIFLGDDIQLDCLQFVDVFYHHLRMHLLGGHVCRLSLLPQADRSFRLYLCTPSQNTTLWGVLWHCHMYTVAYC